VELVMRSEVDIGAEYLYVRVGLPPRAAPLLLQNAEVL
jgi:hypothetical protein